MKPSYSSNTPKEFYKEQKDKGLQKKYWKDLPTMWKNERKHRKELQELLDILTR